MAHAELLPLVAFRAGHLVDLFDFFKSFSWEHRRRKIVEQIDDARPRCTLQWKLCMEFVRLFSRFVESLWALREFRHVGAKMSDVDKKQLQTLRKGSPTLPPTTQSSLAWGLLAFYSRLQSSAKVCKIWLSDNSRKMLTNGYLAIYYVYSQNSASIQPRTRLLKFLGTKGSERRAFGGLTPSGSGTFACMLKNSMFRIHLDVEHACLVFTSKYRTLSFAMVNV